MNDREKASQARAKISKLITRMSDLGKTVIAKRSLLKGTIVQSKRRCGHSNCKCAKGQLHETTVLTLSHQGKSKTIPLTKQPANVLEQLRKQVSDYQSFRRSRSEIVHCFNELMDAINQLELNLFVEVPAIAEKKKTQKG